MLDHAFLAAVETMRRSCLLAMLDRDAGDERFQADLLGGDLTWETSFSLPGEGKPPRVRADVTLDWPTWSQTSYRSWRLEGELDEPPELGIEVVLRLQELVDEPDLATILRVIDAERLYGDDLAPLGWAAEFAYEGAYEFTEPVLAELGRLDDVVGPLGPWVASALVRLGDLRLAFLPPDAGEGAGH